MLLWSSAIKFDVVGRGQSIAKSTGETKKSTTDVYLLCFLRTLALPLSIVVVSVYQTFGHIRQGGEFLFLSRQSLLKILMLF